MRKLFGGIGSFLQTPIGVIIATNVVWQIVMWVMKIPTYGIVYYIASALILGLDIFVAFTLRDQLIHFFSQFVLPIQNPKYRQDIFARVRDFESGHRGPALFVKNGRVIMHEGEADKRGPGLIVLDTASALVLRTDTEIKDTVGPGIKFTSEGMNISRAVLIFGRSGSSSVRLPPTSHSSTLCRSHLQKNITKPRVAASKPAD